MQREWLHANHTLSIDVERKKSAAKIAKIVNWNLSHTWIVHISTYSAQDYENNYTVFDVWIGE